VFICDENKFRMGPVTMVGNSLLETRNSLLVRLSNRRDIEAWDQFIEIYQPFVFRLVRSKGFQDADAHDIVQEVMMAVSKAIHRWETDPAKGRFRDWLFCIARNLMINFLTRRRHQSFRAGQGMLVELLDQHLEQGEQFIEASREFDLEYRRELFLMAAERVSQAVRPKTWDAFRLTSIEQRSIKDAAQELQMTEGAVLVARCRVLARMRELVKSLEVADSGK
jgi:RNA polymerase sigma factor (sigma-70 family)